MSYIGQVGKKKVMKNVPLVTSPGQSPGRAIVLPPASALALAKCYSFYIKVFYVMGKVLSGELPCPCDNSCFKNMELYP